MWAWSGSGMTLNLKNFGSSSAGPEVVAWGGLGEGVPASDESAESVKISHLGPAERSQGQQLCWLTWQPGFASLGRL